MDSFNTFNIKSEPITYNDDENDRDYLSCLKRDKDFNRIKNTYLMSDFEEFQSKKSIRIKMECNAEEESLSTGKAYSENVDKSNQENLMNAVLSREEKTDLTIKSEIQSNNLEMMEDTRMLFDTSYTQVKIEGSSKDIDQSSTHKFDSSSSKAQFHVMGESDMFCSEVLDSSCSEMSSTNDNRGGHLITDVQSLSYSEIDISYPDIKKECEEYKAETTTSDATKNVIKCPQCTYTCYHRSRLTLHLITHIGGKNFTCEICNRAFSRKDGLKKHTFTHSVEKPFQCSQCPRGFRRKDTLKTHMFVHTRDHERKTRVATHRSNSSWNSKQTWFNSYGKFVDTSEETFKCPICHYLTSKKETLKRHLFNHSVGQQYSCLNNQSSILSMPVTQSGFDTFIRVGKQLYTASSQNSYRQPENPTENGSPLMQFNLNISQKLNVPNYSVSQGNRLNMAYLTRKPFKCSMCSFTCFSKSILHLHKLSLGYHLPFNFFSKNM